MNKINKLIILFVFLIPLYASAEIKTSTLRISEMGLQGGARFNLKVTEGCQFGDFDAILHDLAYSKAPKFLISLTNHTEGTEIVQEIFSEVTAGDLAYTEAEKSKMRQEVFQFYERLKSKGIEIIFKDPLRPGLYSLRLCKDTNNEKSCKNKAVKDISTIIKAYQNPPKDYSPPDSVYYYQALKIAEEQFTFVESYSSSDSSSLQTLFGSDEVFLKDFQTINSTSMIFNEKSLEIKLPVFSKVKCGQ